MYATRGSRPDRLEQTRRTAPFRRRPYDVPFPTPREVCTLHAVVLEPCIVKSEGWLDAKHITQCGRVIRAFFFQTMFGFCHSRFKSPYSSRKNGMSLHQMYFGNRLFIFIRNVFRGNNDAYNLNRAGRESFQVATLKRVQYTRGGRCHRRKFESSHWPGLLLI